MWILRCFYYGCPSIGASFIVTPRAAALLVSQGRVLAGTLLCLSLSEYMWLSVIWWAYVSARVPRLSGYMRRPAFHYECHTHCDAVPRLVWGFIGSLPYASTPSRMHVGFVYRHAAAILC